MRSASARKARFGGMGFWTDWAPLTTPAFHVYFASYTSGSPTPTPQGIAFDGYEYRRCEPGAIRFFLPVRFPGQYADVETGLFENWNRFCGPATGRYETTTEPLLQSSAWVAAMAEAAVPAPAFA